MPGHAQTRLRVCIDARLPHGRFGGIEGVISSLAGALSRLDDGPERYSFLAYSDSVDWLRPHIGGACDVLPYGKSPLRASAAGNLRRAAAIVRDAPAALAGGGKVLTVDGPSGPVRHHFDALHSLLPAGSLTSIPTIYHPHDLQHRHLPQYFSSFRRLRREILYRTLCHQARCVVVESSWSKADLIEQFRLRQGKIAVVPFASTLSSLPPPAEHELEEIRSRLHLPQSFTYYPAQTWPHKNHIRLLRSLAQIRQTSGETVPLVCSGYQDDFFPTILRESERLGVANQVYWVGFLEPRDVLCLYRLCRLVVIPSLLEAASEPMYEAFEVGAPVACSNLPSLAGQARAAAVFFDPTSIDDIATAVGRLWSDETLRNDLKQRGRALALIFPGLERLQLSRDLQKNGWEVLDEEDRNLLTAKPPV